jgi:phytoene dehydrogenase-like protein
VTAPRSSARAIVVGSGPNGLAAAITLAQAGLEVTVFEAEETIGGGSRSAELTLPGFTHDVCSAIHPMGVASPFFNSLPLARYGLTWIHPSAPLGHPLDDGSAVVLQRSLEATAITLGKDGRAYRRLFGPLVAESTTLLDALLVPLIPPRHRFALARFGLTAIRSAEGLARSRFRGEAARALFAGIGAHSLLPLDATASASFALVLGMAGHSFGWPLPRGGAQAIPDALAAHLSSLGGSIVTGYRVVDADELGAAEIVMFDTSPRQLVEIAGDRLPPRYRAKLLRYKYGPAAFKLDWALAEPIPWSAAECRGAGTVHVGGTLGEIAAGERDVAHGQHPARPFVLLAQPSVFDETRAPAGRHTAWAYCHVPNRSTVDMTERIEAQVERFAPGFRDLILERRVTTPADLERHNANYIGGDIVGGANTLWQTIARPTLSWNPYAVPVRGWYLCSASTPPGGGVHGMSGFNAARSALRSLGIREAVRT